MFFGKLESDRNSPSTTRNGTDTTVCARKGNTNDAHSSEDTPQYPRFLFYLPISDRCKYKQKYFTNQLFRFSFPETNLNNYNNLFHQFE